MPPDVQINSHQYGYGHGAENREGGPGAGEHGVDHRNGQARQGEHQNEEDGHGRHAANGRVDFFRGNVRQALPLMPDRGEEDDHVMHGPGNDRAEDDPQRPGQIAELGGQDRP